MKKIGLLFLIIFLFTIILPASIYATPTQDAIKKAVRLKMQGRLEEALDLYEKTLETDKLAISEPDNGLMKDLLAKLEKKAKAGDSAVLYKIADYYDKYGNTDKAIEYFTKVTQTDNEELKAESLIRIKSLKKEKELYKKSMEKLKEVETTTAEKGNTNNQNVYSTPPVNNQPAENAFANSANEQKKSELKEKIANFEKEVAEAEKKMIKNKRDREGRGNVRTWRLKEEDKNKDKYSNTFSRRYRTSKKEYEAKLEELNKMKEELNKLK